MEVRWSTVAVDDLERIFRRIEKDNPTAARETVKAIYDGCAALSVFPNRGRSGRMNGRRELVFSPYIAVYQIKAKAVEISRIFHVRRIGLRELLGSASPESRLFMENYGGVAKVRLRCRNLGVASD
jgi:toxin ParE1/3/4